MELERELQGDGMLIFENGNKQTKEADIKDKAKSAPASGGKPDCATGNKPDLTTKDKPRNRPDQSTKGNSDQATKGKPDQATKGKPDQATKGKPDQATRGKPDQETKGKPDQATKSKPDQTTKGKSDTAVRGRPDHAAKGKPDVATRGQPARGTQDLTRDKPDLISKASTPGLSDAEFEEILRKERENKTISLRDMIAGLKAREKYREENNMNPSSETLLEDPKVESNAKDIEGIKCVSESKDIKKFIIVQHENIDKYKKGQSFDILRYSATQCGMLLQWWQKCVYTKHPYIYKCSIWLEGKFLGEGYSTSYDDSKTLAANVVLTELYPNHSVISVKGNKTPASKKTIQYKEISEKVKILMTATGEEIPKKRPKINDWIIQMCKEHITEYKDSDSVEMLKLTQGYTDEELSLIQSFSVAMGLVCNYQKGKPIFIHKVIDPEAVLKKLKKPGSTDKSFRLLDNKDKRIIMESFKN